ncbi:MAG: hypothetical protein KF752_02870 [Pirellulaceae bacterium]|nr:hypothetical protein [Pirellulaceae bacterium]
MKWKIVRHGPVNVVVIRLKPTKPAASTCCLPINSQRRNQLEDYIKAKISHSRDINMSGDLSHANGVLLGNAKQQNLISYTKSYLVWWSPLSSTKRSSII